ncbi:MAG: hypothetical protein MUE53_05980 [Chitinophagales bacterium]|jgi:hypothetical protein|nr:hypothetical protein [Chitinophagales bacterium]
MKNLIFLFLLFISLGCNKSNEIDKEIVRYDDNGNYISGDTSKYGVSRYSHSKEIEHVFKVFKIGSLPEKNTCFDSPVVRIYPNPPKKDEPVYINISSKSSKVAHCYLEYYGGSDLYSYPIPSYNILEQFEPGMMVDGKVRRVSDFTIYVITEDSCSYKTNWKMIYQ